MRPATANASLALAVTLVAFFAVSGSATAALDRGPSGGLVANGGALTSRHTPAGEVDRAFFGNGYFRDRYLRGPNDVAVGPRGAVYLSGDEGGLTKLTPSGAVEHFNFDFFGGVENDPPTFAAVDLRGRVLLAGTFVSRQPCDGNPTGTGFDRSYASLARIRPNGSLDTSFGGGDGFALTPSPSTDCAQAEASFMTSPVVAPDGSIIVGGSGTLAKFTPNGVPDPSFGDGDGLIELPVLDIGDIGVQTDGKIIAGGRTPRHVVVRFMPNGDVDLTFGGGDGRVRAGAELVVRLDDRIVAASAERTDCPTPPCGTRLDISFLTPDGLPDSTRGSGGTATHRMPFEFSNLDIEGTRNGVVVQGQVAYRAFGPLGQWGSALIAVDGETGALDPGFSGDGITLPPRPPRKCAGLAVKSFFAGFGSPERDFGRDFLYSAGATAYFGYSGDDVINSGLDRSTDSVPSTPGRDHVCAGGGDDLIITGRDGQVVLGGAGDDRLLLGPGADRAVGGRGFDRLSGGKGNDRLRSRDGRRDVVHCGAGADWVRADPVDELRSCERRTS